MRVDIGDGFRLFVDIEGAKYEVRDDQLIEKPTLLLIHGGPGFDHSGFKPAFAAYTDICQVVYFDNRGNGRSDYGDRSLWNLDTWADDVVRLCDALEITRPIVFGNSFGGMVAMNYLARHPEHPAKIILSSTAARMQMEAVFSMFNTLGGDEAESVARKFWLELGFASVEEYLRVCGPHYTRTRGNPLAQSYVVRNPDVGQHFRLGEQKTMNLLPGLARARCPVLVLAGAWDPVTPVAAAEAIVEALPAEHVQYELFENAGHGVFRDEPERAEAILRRFILA
jgi:pimeloyl-ACP methyl ester carboxylesterase